MTLPNADDAKPSLRYHADTPDDAAQLRAHAAVRRAEARQEHRRGNAEAGAWCEAEADASDEAASRVLRPTPPPDVDMAAVAAEVALFREDRAVLAAEAGGRRIELAGGDATLALDAAAAVGARNSAEVMIAHQMAAAHALAMRLAGLAGAYTSSASAERMAGRPAGTYGPPPPARASVEAARLALAAARLMEASQGAVVTLAKLRSGGHQTVTVQHVHVGEGGQAMVAGSVAPGGQLRGQGRPGGG